MGLAVQGPKQKQFQRSKEAQSQSTREFNSGAIPDDDQHHQQLKSASVKNLQARKTTSTEEKAPQKINTVIKVKLAEILLYLKDFFNERPRDFLLHLGGCKVDQKEDAHCVAQVYVFVAALTICGVAFLVLATKLSVAAWRKRRVKAARKNSMMKLKTADNDSEKPKEALATADSECQVTRL
ncbi:hypothetical protein TYRP_006079 [Tyrophagus putrescentiae]|nr:hypothetical protein TYRP_006079 [Tyrophagus putrescentiae]